MKREKVIFWAILFVLAPFIGNCAETGKFQYEDFKKPKRCGVCHKEIYQEWRQCLMSQSFTHEWDQVEYFKLALPHALKLEKVSGVKGGCIACQRIGQAVNESGS